MSGWNDEPPIPYGTVVRVSPAGLFWAVVGWSVLGVLLVVVCMVLFPGKFDQGYLVGYAIAWVPLFVAGGAAAGTVCGAAALIAQRFSRDRQLGSRRAMVATGAALPQLVVLAWAISVGGISVNLWPAVLLLTVQVVGSWRSARDRIIR